MCECVCVSGWCVLVCVGYVGALSWRNTIRQSFLLPRPRELPFDHTLHSFDNWYRPLPRIACCSSSLLWLQQPESVFAIEQTAKYLLLTWAGKYLCGASALCRGELIESCHCIAALMAQRRFECSFHLVSATGTNEIRSPKRYLKSLKHSQSQTERVGDRSALDRPWFAGVDEDEAILTDWSGWFRDILYAYTFVDWRGVCNKLIKLTSYHFYEMYVCSSFFIGFLPFIFALLTLISVALLQSYLCSSRLTCKL